jgi:hypothetical protein
MVDRGTDPHAQVGSAISRMRRKTGKKRNRSILTDF